MKTKQAKHTPLITDAVVDWALRDQQESLQCVGTEAERLEVEENIEYIEKVRQLIEAAPELLEAAKEAAEVIKAQNNGNCLAKLLDAIAKATGQGE